MSSESVKELPKPLTNPLKSELLSRDHHLKHADTQEKVVLPSAQEIEEEKKEKSLLNAIESFDSQKGLKSVPIPQEKNVLPTKEDLELEKKQ